MKKQTRKLALHRETLVRLEAVRGGEQAATGSCVRQCYVASNYLTTCCPPISGNCQTQGSGCITD